MRRKKSTRTTDRGSVLMLGQKLTIRIIEAEYLSEQRVNRYRYEVMSPKSQFRGRVDFASVSFSATVSRYAVIRAASRVVAHE